ncbi:MAG: hypothetical protein WCP12_11160, partial [bacterium]
RHSPNGYGYVTSRYCLIALLTLALSAFAEWFPLRSNEPYCVIALLTYTTAEKYLDPIKGIRHKGGARACIAIRPTLSSIRMVRAFRMLKIILTG